MSTLNIVLIVIAAVLGIAWYTRRKNRIRREKKMGR
jgi:hypothetical protein